MRRMMCLVLGSVLVACHPGPADDADDATGHGLFRSPAEFDFSENPELLSRLRDSPYDFFRFMNRGFAQTVCAELDGFRADAPSVNLHGDAHLEQYAVTPSGRGLMDFDDAASGPPIVDLARFGVSIYLAAMARGWDDQKEKFLGRFLDGYRRALGEPDFNASAPELVARIREGFDPNRVEVLARSEALMEPLESGADENGRVFGEGARLLTSSMQEQHPSLPEGFFSVKSSGALRLGVGSALDRKFLFRVEGASLDPSDDVILEAKELRDLTGVDCVYRRRNDPFTILAAQSRLAYQPYEFVGFFYLDPEKTGTGELGDLFWDGSVFWVHSWVDNYTEITVGTSLERPADLAEIAFDVGVQLGYGHTRGIADPLDDQLRATLLQAWTERDAHYAEAVLAMTDQVIEAWEQFRTE